MTSVSAEPVMKSRMLSSSRTRATYRRRAGPEIGERQSHQVAEQPGAEITSMRLVVCENT